MSEFIQQLANMIAQARPQVIPGQGAAPFLGQVAATVKSPPLENVIGETIGRTGGQIAGRKLGEILKKKLNLYNPEDIKKMKGEIDFIRDNMFNLSGEKKKAFMQRILDPSIQSRFREFNEVIPERFVPASVVTGDDSHSGYLMPVPKVVPKEKIVEYGKADITDRYLKGEDLPVDEKIIAIKALGGDSEAERQRKIAGKIKEWEKTQKGKTYRTQLEEEALQAWADGAKLNKQQERIISRIYPTEKGKTYRTQLEEEALQAWADGAKLNEQQKRIISRIYPIVNEKKLTPKQRLELDKELAETEVLLTDPGHKKDRLSIPLIRFFNTYSKTPYMYGYLETGREVDLLESKNPFSSRFWGIDVEDEGTTRIDLPVINGRQITARDVMYTAGKGKSVKQILADLGVYNAD
ncbi:MAG: hypothetical protein OCU18_03900 [Candidatus Syntrophoarchaeum sp.]|nr:hypothetical protein [Candidatus Syntrophoarchaeum sp.]